MSRLASIRSCLAGLCLLAPAAAGQDESIPFDAAAWDLDQAKLGTHLGRPSLMGVAGLRDVSFEDGVIEVDVAVDGRRSYPGLLFRVQSEANYERLYLRPHRAGLYPDALQYVPCFNGVSGWQLYSGAGYTAFAELEPGRWHQLRLELRGGQARVFLNDASRPSLTIPRLQHGASRGGISLHGPADGSAWFSRFRYRHDPDLAFEEARPEEPDESAVTGWEISRVLPATQVDREAYPSFFLLFSAQWREVETAPSGLLDFSRHVTWTRQTSDLIFARKRYRSETRRRVKLTFGYSDAVSLFHNGQLLFAGESAYRSRDPSFVGVVGPFDAVYLDVEKGLNELFLMVSEDFGGWGLMAEASSPLEPPRREHQRARKVWETDAVFLTPESVLHDPERDVLYVTSMDVQYRQRGKPSGFLSRLSTEGEILELSWVTGLSAPCGMALDGDTLYVLERGALAEIALPTGEITRRHPIPGTVFLNDVAIDARGRLYLSDSFPATPERTRTIYRCEDGAVAPWIDGDALSRVNGLFVHDGALLVGNTADSSLRAIDLETREIATVTSLGAGIVDGIRLANDGDYLVSHWEGPCYRVSPETGAVIEILDTRPEGNNAADFEYIREKRLLVIPTFLGNRVVAYELDDAPATEER